MNDTIEKPLPIRIQDNSFDFSITSFLFYFLYFLIFVFLCFFIIAYLYPDSSCRKLYNYILLEMSDQNIKKKIVNKKLSDQQNSTNTAQNSTNTTQKLQSPNNNKISLDEAVDQYMELQNQTNSDLGKVNYLPPKQYTNKKGWCLIGEEKGFNSCIEVGRNDYCMSGDIYPTQDICINPSLRL
jgi:hypothetical protein